MKTDFVCVRDGSGILFWVVEALETTRKRYSGQPDPCGNAQLKIKIVDISIQILVAPTG